MLKRTHMCGSLRSEHQGQDVVVCGWVNTYRDHSSGLVFIDLRDREGLVQVVFDGDDSEAGAMEVGRALRREDVVAISGVVRARAGGANPKLGTGEIEVVARFGAHLGACAARTWPWPQARMRESGVAVFRHGW